MLSANCSRWSSIASRPNIVAPAVLCCGSQRSKGRRILARAFEELRDERPVVVHVDEEGVVALQRAQLDELDLAPRCLEPLGKLALLMNREQKIRRHADDERALDLNLGEPRRYRRAVIGHVEQVARA